MIPDEAQKEIDAAIAAAKKRPEGLDFPLLPPEKKFPINLFNNHIINLYQANFYRYIYQALF